MNEIEVISDPGAAATALDPVRSRLLAELGEPGSAAELASRVGLARQKVNYHLRALEACGLVSVAEERLWGGLTERRLVASASSFVISPEALGPAAADPSRTKDRLAASYLIALGARILGDVGDLLRGARQAGKPLATLAIDTEIHFASPQDRAAFTREGPMTAAGQRHIDAAKADGRWENAYAGPSEREIPQDFLHALEGNPAAKASFATPDRKNLYPIYYCPQMAKRPETRQKRMSGVLEQLARAERFHQ